MTGSIIMDVTQVRSPLAKNTSPMTCIHNLFYVNNSSSETCIHL